MTYSIKKNRYIIDIVGYFPNIPHSLPSLIFFTLTWFFTYALFHLCSNHVIFSLVFDFIFCYESLKLSLFTSRLVVIFKENHSVWSVFVCILLK